MSITMSETFSMNKVKIQGYKSIKDIELELMPVNVLIGANGAGKSNFVSFFEFLHQLYCQNLQHHIAMKGGEEKILFGGTKESQNLSARIDFGYNAYSFRLTLGDESLLFAEEDLWYQEDVWHKANYRKEAIVSYEQNGRGAYINQYLNRFIKYHFHDTGRKSPFTNLSHIENDAYYLYADGSNLAAYLFAIQKNEGIIYRRIIKTIQSIAPYFSDFFFQPNANGYLRLQWKNKYSTTVYGVNDLSDGTLRFIALCVLFLQPQLPSCIIIDEPELGLHPTAIGKLAALVGSVIGKNTQVIMATQSVELVNHFEAKDVITVDQYQGASQFKRLDEEELAQWLTEYSVGDLWQRSIIQGGQPK